MIQQRDRDPQDYVARRIRAKKGKRKSSSQARHPPLGCRERTVTEKKLLTDCGQPASTSGNLSQRVGADSGRSPAPTFPFLGLPFLCPPLLAFQGGPDKKLGCALPDEKKNIMERTLAEISPVRLYTAAVISASVYTRLPPVILARIALMLPPFPLNPVGRADGDTAAADKRRLPTNLPLQCSPVFTSTPLRHHSSCLAGHLPPSPTSQPPAGSVRVSSPCFLQAPTASDSLSEKSKPTAVVSLQLEGALASLPSFLRQLETSASPPEAESSTASGSEKRASCQPRLPPSSSSAAAITFCSSDTSVAPSQEQASSSSSPAHPTLTPTPVAGSRTVNQRCGLSFQETASSEETELLGGKPTGELAVCSPYGDTRQVSTSASTASSVSSLVVLATGKSECGEDSVGVTAGSPPSPSPATRGVSETRKDLAAQADIPFRFSPVSHDGVQKALFQASSTASAVLPILQPGVAFPDQSAARKDVSRPCAFSFSVKKRAQTSTGETRGTAASPARGQPSLAQAAQPALRKGEEGERQRRILAECIRRLPPYALHLLKVAKIFWLRASLSPSPSAGHDSNRLGGPKAGDANLFRLLFGSPLKLSRQPPGVTSMQKPEEAPRSTLSFARAAGEEGIMKEAAEGKAGESCTCPASEGPLPGAWTAETESSKDVPGSSNSKISGMPTLGVTLPPSSWGTTASGGTQRIGEKEVADVSSHSLLGEGVGVLRKRTAGVDRSSDRGEPSSQGKELLSPHTEPGEQCGVTDYVEALSARATGLLQGTEDGARPFLLGSQKWEELLARPLPSSAPFPKKLRVSPDTEAAPNTDGALKNETRASSPGVSEARLTALDAMASCPFCPSAHRTEHISPRAQEATAALRPTGLSGQGGESCGCQGAHTALRPGDTACSTEDPTCTAGSGTSDGANAGKGCLAVYRVGGIDPLCSDKSESGAVLAQASKSLGADLDGRKARAAASPSLGSSVHQCPQTGDAPAGVPGGGAAADGAAAVVVSEQARAHGDLCPVGEDSVCRLEDSKDGAVGEVRHTGTVCMSKRPGGNCNCELGTPRELKTGDDPSITNSARTAQRLTSARRSQSDTGDDTASRTYRKCAEPGPNDASATEYVPYEGQKRDPANRSRREGEDLPVPPLSLFGPSDCGSVRPSSDPCATESALSDATDKEKTAEVLAVPPSAGPRADDLRNVRVLPHNSTKTEMALRVSASPPLSAKQLHADSGEPAGVGPDRLENLSSRSRDSLSSEQPTAACSLVQPRKDALPAAVSPPAVSSLPSAETACFSLPPDEQETPACSASEPAVGAQEDSSCLPLSGVRDEASLLISCASLRCSPLLVEEKNSEARKCCVSGLLSPGSLNTLSPLDSPLPLSSSLLQGPSLPDFSPASTALLKKFGALQNSSVSCSLPIPSSEDCCDKQVEEGAAGSSLPGRAEPEISLPCSTPASDSEPTPDQSPVPCAAASPVAPGSTSSVSPASHLAGASSSCSSPSFSCLAGAPSLPVAAVGSDAAGAVRPSRYGVTAASEAGRAGTSKLLGVASGLTSALTSRSASGIPITSSESESPGASLAPASIEAASAARNSGSGAPARLCMGGVSSQPCRSIAARAPACSSSPACAASVSSFQSGEATPAPSGPGAAPHDAPCSSGLPFRCAVPRNAPESLCFSCPPASVTPPAHGVCVFSSESLNCTPLANASDAVCSSVYVPVPMPLSGPSEQASSTSSDTPFKAASASPPLSAKVLREISSKEVPATSSGLLRSPTRSPVSPSPRSSSPVVNTRQLGSPLPALADTQSVPVPSSGPVSTPANASVSHLSSSSASALPLCPQRSWPTAVASSLQSGDPFVSLLASPIPTRSSLLLAPSASKVLAPSSPSFSGSPERRSSHSRPCSAAPGACGGKSFSSKAARLSQPHVLSEVSKPPQRGTFWKYRTGGGFCLEGCHVAGCNIDCTNLKTAVRSAWACIRDHKDLPPGLICFLQGKRTQNDENTNFKESSLARKPGAEHEGAEEAKSKKASQPRILSGYSCAASEPGNSPTCEAFQRPVLEGDQRSGGRRDSAANGAKLKRAESTSPSTPSSVVQCSGRGSSVPEPSRTARLLGVPRTSVKEYGRHAASEQRSLVPGETVGSSRNTALGSRRGMDAGVGVPLSLQADTDSTRDRKLREASELSDETSLHGRAGHVCALPRKRRATATTEETAALEPRPNDAGPRARLQGVSSSPSQSRHASRDKRRRIKQDAPLECSESQAAVKVLLEDEVLESSRSASSEPGHFFGNKQGSEQHSSQGSPSSARTIPSWALSSSEAPSLSGSRSFPSGGPCFAAEVHLASRTGKTVSGREEVPMLGDDNESPHPIDGRALFSQSLVTQESGTVPETAGESCFNRSSNTRYWEKADEEIILKMIQRSFGYVCDLSEVSVEDVVGVSEEDEDGRQRTFEGVSAGKTVVPSGEGDCRKTEKTKKTASRPKQHPKKENQGSSSGSHPRTLAGKTGGTQGTSGTVDENVTRRHQQCEELPVYGSQTKGKLVRRHKNAPGVEEATTVISEEGGASTTRKENRSSKKSRRFPFPFLTPENYRQLGTRENTLLARRRLDGTPTPHLFEPEAADGDRLFTDGYKWLPKLLIQTFGLLDCTLLGYQARHISLIPANFETSSGVTRVTRSSSQLPCLLSDGAAKLSFQPTARQSHSLQYPFQQEQRREDRRRQSNGDELPLRAAESDVETACTILKAVLRVSETANPTKLDCGSASPEEINLPPRTFGSGNPSLKVHPDRPHSSAEEETKQPALQRASESAREVCRSTFQPEKAAAPHADCSDKTNGSGRHSTSEEAKPRSMPLPDGIPGSSVTRELKSHEAYVDACSNDPLYWPWVGLHYSGVRISLRRYHDNIEDERYTDTQASLPARAGQSRDAEAECSGGHVTSGGVRKEKSLLSSVSEPPPRSFLPAAASVSLSDDRVTKTAAREEEHREGGAGTQLFEDTQEGGKEETTEVGGPGMEACSKKETDGENEEVLAGGKGEGSRPGKHSFRQDRKRDVSSEAKIGDPREEEVGTTEREGRVAAAGDSVCSATATDSLTQETSASKKECMPYQRKQPDDARKDTTDSRQPEAAVGTEQERPLLYACAKQDSPSLPKRVDPRAEREEARTALEQNVSRGETRSIPRKQDKHPSGCCECMYTEDVYALKCIVAVPIGVLKKNVITFSPPLSCEKQAAIRRWGAGSHNKVILRFTEVFWPQSAPFLNPSFTPLFQFMNLHAFGKANCLVAHSFGNYCWDFVRRIRERREARRSARRKSAGTPGEPCRVDSSLRQLTDSETQAKKEVCLGRWPENSTGAAQQGTATVGGSRSSFVFTGHACVGKQKQERNDSSTSARHARDEDSGKPSGVAAQGRHDAAQLASLQSVSTTGPGTGRELCRVIVPKESWDKDHSDGADNPSEPSRSSADGHKFSSQGKEADKEKDVSELEEALSSEEDWDESDHWALWAEGNEVRGSEEKNNTRKRVSDEEVVNECCLVLKRMFNLRKKPWPIQAIVTRWDEDPLYYCSYGFPSKETQEGDQQLLSQPHPWAPSVPLPVKKFLHTEAASTEDPAGSSPEAKRKGFGSGKQRRCSDASAVTGDSTWSPGESRRLGTAESAPSESSDRPVYAPDALLEAQFVSSLSDSLVYFCGEHTSDFGQQCVHGAMHSGARAAAECLASLLNCDGVPWCQNGWGTIPKPNPVGGGSRSTEAAGGCSPERASEHVMSSVTARRMPVGGSGKNTFVREGTGSESGYTAANRNNRAQDDIGPTVIDDWRTWWYGSDGAFVYGKDGSATHGAPRDVFLRKALTREQRVGILRRRISEFIEAMGANENA